MTKARPKFDHSPDEALVVAKRRVAEWDGSPRLDLSRLGLERLPDGLARLKPLRELSLERNRLDSLPEWIGELTQLSTLAVHLNPLRSLPSSLRRLTKLEVLYIDTADPEAADPVIGSLRNLRRLALVHMGLKELPSFLRHLRRLETLYVMENQITELPSWLSELRGLERLAVYNNRLKSLPAFLGDLPSLRILEVDGNPDLGLPEEILESGSPRKILDYYLRTAAPGAAEPLNEFKLVLVGRGGVGKTTLVHKLVTDEYKEFKRTPGINITKWPTKIDGEEVRAHVWDFGGQEIMHGTHRFFMTERALYLLLISGREGTEDHDADYWLSLIRSFAGDVPVVVLLHKWADYSFELSRELLREKYGRDLQFLETDSANGHGIDGLRERICELAAGLPGLKAAWPVEWRRVKEELPARKKSWLTFDDFRRFCRARGVGEPRDQEALAESLHDLGLMLSYRREEALRDFGVLNPQWATQGIYKMLNAPSLREAGGKFTVESFAEVLPARTYPEELHPFLLALMRKFRLSHPLDDKGKRHLIPELLTKKGPDLEKEFPPAKCLGFVYRYDVVLPEGLLPRFIVETYVHREPKLAWRTGVVLERANARALVRGDVQGRTITIRVAGVGNSKRELLGIVREHFERIHRSYQNLPVTEEVPVPGHPSVRVPYADLLAYEGAGDDEYKVVIDGRPVARSVKKLLDGVDLPGMARDTAPGADAPARERGEALSLFISYSHKDELFRDELRGALTAYERVGQIEAWDDTRIEAGQAWEPEIFDSLQRADIIVLLLSNDFIRSDYCFQKEMQAALARDKKGECAIVPIVVRACAFEKLELGRIQAIRPKGKAIKAHRDRDVAWREVTKQLDRVIARLKKRRVN